jgi:biotin carboxylase
MSRDAVWIVGASLLQCAMLYEARALGLAVVMTDRNPTAPGAALAEHFEVLDTMDVDGHRTLARTLSQGADLRLRGVVTCGADVGPSVAAAAEVLGTPGLPVEVAQGAHNKYAVRTRLAAARLQRYQPEFLRLRLSQPHVAVLIAEAGEHCGWPLVVKPLEQCASRGVSLLRGPADIAAALAKAQAYGEQVLLEHGLTGSEHSAELIRDRSRRVVFFNIVDRVFRYDGGVPFELGHVNPTRLPRETQREISQLLIQAANALGVTWGPFKADLMVTDDGPKILECTARLSGGWDCQGTTPLASGRNPMRTVLRLACGWALDAEDLVPRHCRTAACAAILPPPGRLVAWDPRVIADGGPVRADRIVLTVKRGDVIPPYAHCATRPGFALAVAETWEGAWQRAQHAAARIAAAMHTEPGEPSDAA